MKSSSHFAMAYLISAALEKRGVTLDRRSFVCGSIAPDYLPSLFFAPHFARACLRGIRSVSGKLAAVPFPEDGKISPASSKAFGVMCHYICDYFCFPHNREFSGTLKEHSAFEVQLDSFLRENCLKLLDVEAREDIDVPRSLRGALNYIERMKREYNEKGYTFENDLCFSFNACVAVILAVVAIERRLAQLQGTSCEPELHFLRARAMGNSYIFRMFFYKNRNCDLFFLPELMPPLFT